MNQVQSRARVRFKPGGRSKRIETLHATTKTDVLGQSRGGPTSKIHAVVDTTACALVRQEAKVDRSPEEPSAPDAGDVPSQC